MQFLRLRVRVKFVCVCDESAVTCASSDGMPVTRRLPRNAYNYNASVGESELEKNALAPEQPQQRPAK
jgi:hypothetical protein